MPSPEVVEEVAVLDGSARRACRRDRLLREPPSPVPSADGAREPYEASSPTSSDTDQHEGRTRFSIPLAPKWGPLPERRPRRVRVWPTLQDRGSSPFRPAPVNQNFSVDYWPDNGWRYDRHPDYSGWNASAAGHGAAMLMNAAYGAASAVSHNFTEVDFRWNTPDKHNVKPLGYNARGDLAPRAVHIVLHPILVRRKVDPKLWPFAHKTMDLAWMLHSRAILRCPQFLKQLDFFTELEVNQLSLVMCEHMFSDGRLLMSALDPREEPIYGRTLDTPGYARIYRMFPFLRRGHESNDDGGASDSSDCSLMRPFERTPDQAIQHLNRHHQRRLRHAVDHADRVEDEIRRVEDEVVRAEERLRAILQRQESLEGLIEIIDHGLNGLAPLKTESWRSKFGLSPPSPAKEQPQWPDVFAGASSSSASWPVVHSPYPPPSSVASPPA